MDIKYTTKTEKLGDIFRCYSTSYGNDELIFEYNKVTGDMFFKFKSYAKPEVFRFNDLFLLNYIPLKFIRFIGAWELRHEKNNEFISYSAIGENNINIHLYDRKEPTLKNKGI